MSSPPSKLTRAKSRLLDRIEAFRLQPDGAARLAYIPSQLVQCTFPHDDPGNVPSWSRSTPWLTVTFQPAYDGRICLGYPFGTVPRLLMFYVMTQIQYRKNLDLPSREKRTIHLGDSLGEFLRNIGMNPDNGSGDRSDRKRLRDQLERFARVRVNFGSGPAFSDMLIAEDGEFWWTIHDDAADEQASLFKSYIVLSDKFYQRVLTSLVPLDMAALDALKTSCLKLDIYAWCLYRAHTLTRGKDEILRVTWASFMAQSGANYAHVRQFRAAVIEALPSVRPFLRGIQVETDTEHITLYPGAEALIPPRPSPSLPPG